VLVWYQSINMLDNVQQKIWYTIVSSTSPWTSHVCIGPQVICWTRHYLTYLFKMIHDLQIRNAHRCNGVRQCVGQFIVILFNRYQLATTYFGVLYS